MEVYQRSLKGFARQLRASTTDAETKLWFQLRRKQIAGVQFYRQKPVASYIVDFYCPAAKLVVELDGSQHLDENALIKDHLRDEALISLGLKVLRFDNRQVLLEMSEVLQVIHHVIEQRIHAG